jgi:acetyltransferase-like isoleucine patch superfamily enzyme
MIEKLFRLVNLVIYYSTSYVYYKFIFNKIGSGSKIGRPLILSGADNISIGTRVIIGKLAWLASDRRFGVSRGIIEIGDGSYIGNNAHIYSTGSIKIGKKVLIADRVYLSDNAHSYEDISHAIIDQPVRQLNEVSIGDHSWIGENVCIIGVKIGRHSIVGANSVVNKDVPDYTIVAGSPAKIIKRFDFDSNSWRRVVHQD